MLIDFKVTNYRSFKNENYFSMEKGNYIRKYKSSVLERGKYKLLKSAILFGGNANGKTNLIKAIELLRFLVIQPTMSENQLLPIDTFGYNDGNTEFKIKFLENKDSFEYHLIYNANEIVREVLTLNKNIILDRNKQTFTHLPEQIKPLEKNIRKNQTLLFFAQTNNVKEAKLAFSWFLENIISVNTEMIPNTLFSKLKEDTFKQKFLKFLRAADFSIVDVEIKEHQENHINFQINNEEGNVISQPNSQLVPITVYDVYSTHKSENGTFEVHFDNESTGTKVFMFLALYILTNKNSEKVFLIDEFNRSFHIELAESLLDLLNNEKQTNQFIMTTHELSLMDYNLRQDQIWFAEKNQHGETELFSIYDFEDIGLKRSDFAYKKRYLEGRFGANQIINKSLLLELLEDNDG